MDDFLIVLSIALAILIIAGFAFSNLPVVPPQGAAENKSLCHVSFGLVGNEYPTVTKEININNLEVGTPQTVSLESLDSKRIESSYFGSQRFDTDVIIEHSILNSLEDININFEVKDTNKYGNLIIKWNDKEISRGLTDGYNSIQIPKNKLNEKNKLSIYAEPPGFQFWASTVYDLKDIVIEGEYGQITPISFSLDQREIETLDKGELILETIEGQGEKLIIRFNGDDIYNKFPPSTDKLILNRGFLLGKNILSFSSEGGIFRINGKLNIYVLTQKTSTKSKTCHISQADIDSLSDNVKLKITVDRIDRPGDLIITINGNDIQKRPTRGLNTILIDKELLKPGENILEVVSTGRFDLSSVKIEK